MADFKGKQIHDKYIEEFLSIEQSGLVDSNLASEYNNEIILITGAAGSIGSELARKIAMFGYKELILIDISESSLYNLQQEFFMLGIKNFILIVADIRDMHRMSQIFDNYKPKIVFHAAAYKHVPLMESNPNEAVGVNILGTKNIADLSITHNIKKCILISTDKAVNPTNVMGATKRIAELYVKCLNGRGNTKFITTRFGNVLGSNGSVIPLFKKQLISGGPITITHKNITRYFMTISTASQLVLQASTMGNGGEIFVFNMGKPIKIYDIALHIIRLSGLKFPDDIDIKIIGLRSGEKFSEELYSENEIIKSTSHDKILMIETKPFKKEIIETKINMLCKKNFKSQKLEIVAIMKNILPEYVSNNSKFELLDSTN
ncbi:polysaccharide biosynthesis protein [Flavobacteriaceae bacterium PRS1]|nr:polysaccharide biosynthesis protein [Flavobacteriaceae bacterium PRS1]